MDALTALLTRNSAPKLSAPAPSQTVLDTAFAAAFRAPDHAWLRPWRYRIIEGAGLQALGELFVEARLMVDQAMPVEEQQKLKAKPLRAPMIIVVASHVTDHPKVPAVEQHVSAGASAHALLLALHAQGFAAVWRTGSLATNAHVHQGLGFTDNERILGFLYVGTREGKAKTIPVLDQADFVSHWPVNE